MSRVGLNNFVDYELLIIISSYVYIGYTGDEQTTHSLTQQQEYRAHNKYHYHDNTNKHNQGISTFL